MPLAVGNVITGNGTVPAGGTTNQVLQKTSATDYAISWATPATGATIASTGDILKGDGSGNAVALGTSTTGKILKSYGGAFIPSTETFAAPGTAGQVLRSNATNWLSALLNFSDLTGNWALSQGAVTTASVLLGRGSTGSGTPNEITLGTNLSMSGTTLNATGGNVSNSGTPTVGQYGRWVTATTIEGVATSTVKTDLALTATDVGLGNVTNNAQTQSAIVPNTAPTAGQILVGNAGNTAYAKQTLSGSGATATLSSAGVLTLSAIPESSLSITNVTTGDATTSAHGFAPKGTVGTTQFWRQDWTLAVPAGGGNVSTSGTITTGQHARWASGTTIESITAATAKTDLALNNVTNDAQIKASDFPAPSVDSEVALFSGTSGKVLKRATATGIATLASGVLSSTPDNHANWDTAYTRSTYNATNLAVASLQVITTADTYITGSLITVAAGDFVVGMTYHIMLQMSKTAAGTNAGPWTFRVGTAGSTSDAGTAVFAALAGTAVADVMSLELWITFTAVGASAQVRYNGNFVHNNTATGFYTGTATGVLITGGVAQSASFSTTTATKIGMSYTGGTSAAHTMCVCKAELFRP